MKIKINTI